MENSRAESVTFIHLAAHLSARLSLFYLRIVTLHMVYLINPLFALYNDENNGRGTTRVITLLITKG